MKKRFLMLLVLWAGMIMAIGQDGRRLYNEEIDPFVQIDEAVESATKLNKFVVCQLGGNWCPWCLRFAKFIKEDEEIANVVADNFVYIHVNYKSHQDSLSQRINQRLANAGRFGFPVLVILSSEGAVMHIQNSAYLEEGQGYNRKRVLDFFKLWTPAAVKGSELSL